MLAVFDFSVFISQDRGILDDHLKIGILCFCVEGEFHNKGLHLVHTTDLAGAVIVKSVDLFIQFIHVIRISVGIFFRCLVLRFFECEVFSVIMEDQGISIQSVLIRALRIFFCQGSAAPIDRDPVLEGD